MSIGRRVGARKNEDKEGEGVFLEDHEEGREPRVRDV